jgi:hypothetical protein
MFNCYSYNNPRVEIGVGRIMVPAFFFAGDGGLDRLARFGEPAIQSAS